MIYPTMHEQDSRYPENWEKLRRYILKRDNYVCQICKRHSNLIVHHIHYIGWGGSSHPRNLIVLCRDCHKRIHHLL